MIVFSKEDMVPVILASFRQVCNNIAQYNFPGKAGDALHKICCISVHQKELDIIFRQCALISEALHEFESTYPYLTELYLIRLNVIKNDISDVIH